MLQTILITSGVLLVINIVLWFVAIRIFSAIYQDKFDMIVQIIHEGMAERDAKLRVIQAMLSKAFVTDTRLFDILMEEGEGSFPEELVNEREEENQG